jgi:purine-binding chemotaxis protein CheW
MSGSNLDDAVRAIDEKMAGIQGGEAVAAATGDTSRGVGEELEQRFIVFSLGQVRYAVRATGVVEISKVPDFTAVPNVPEWVLGVTNIRGDIVTVAHLRLFLGMEAEDSYERGRIMVVRSSRGEVTSALVIDAVQGMRRFAPGRIKPPRSPLDDRIAPYLDGVLSADESLVCVLDLERLLLSSEFRMFEA